MPLFDGGETSEMLFRLYQQFSSHKFVEKKEDNNVLHRPTQRPYPNTKAIQRPPDFETSYSKI